MLKDIFTEDVVKHFKEHKEEITHELLEELRSYGNEGKQLCLDILDTPKDEEEYHLDAFGHRISFNGDRTLKKAMTKMNLAPIHIDEIKRCATDIEYFKDNYVKIKTRKGVNFPDLRDYQNEFIQILADDENDSIVAMMPRQCITAGTMIDIGEKVSVYDLYKRYKPQKIRDEKIQEYVEPNVEVLTPRGYQKIVRVQKMVPMLKVQVKTQDFALQCAEKHVIIGADGSEIYAKDALGKEVQTIRGVQKVVDVKEFGYNEDMFDLVLDGEHLYYTNGILSHNSGKTSTTSIFLAWKYNFTPELLNIGILANKGATAREFLASTKDILVNLPMWMQAGTVNWSQKYILNENKGRILTDVPSDSAFRGFTINIIVVDEQAWIKTSVIEPTLDALLPSQAALSYKKNIFLSTPHGLNHFSTCVNGAKKRKIMKDRDPDEMVLMEDGSKMPLYEVYEKLNSGELKLPDTKDYIDGIAQMEGDR